MDFFLVMYDRLLQINKLRTEAKLINLFFTPTKPNPTLTYTIKIQICCFYIAILSNKCYFFLKRLKPGK